VWTRRSFRFICFSLHVSRLPPVWVPFVLDLNGHEPPQNQSSQRWERRQSQPGFYVGARSAPLRRPRNFLRIFGLIHLFRPHERVREVVTLDLLVCRIGWRRFFKPPPSAIRGRRRDFFAYDSPTLLAPIRLFSGLFEYDIARPLIFLPWPDVFPPYKNDGPAIIIESFFFSPEFSGFSSYTMFFSRSSPSHQNSSSK